MSRYDEDGFLLNPVEIKSRSSETASCLLSGPLCTTAASAISEFQRIRIID